MLQQRLPALCGSDFNPEPDGTIMALLTAADGVQLRGAFWPARDTVRGTLIVLQGRSETIEKYFETIGEWRARGFAVFAFDWRGQGGSQRLLADGRKGHVAHFSDYQWDLDAAVAWLRAHGAPEPFFGFGHSMGGAILIEALTRQPTLFERATTTAPMLDVMLVSQTVWAGRLAAILSASGFGTHYVPKGGPNPVLFKPFDNNFLTRDRARHKRSQLILETAPDLALGDPTIQWVATSFSAMARLRGMAAAVTTPLLGVASAHDRVTSTLAAQAFFDALPHGQFLALADCEHEILIETDHIRGQFWRAFDEFMACDALSPARAASR